MAFVKQDMDFVRYSWEMEESDASVIFSGEPSRRVFDPGNGHQVLFLINYYASVTGQLSVADAQQLENKLARQLPLGKMSELSVLKWMIGNK